MIVQAVSPCLQLTRDDECGALRLRERSACFRTPLEIFERETARDDPGKRARTRVDSVGLFLASVNGVRTERPTRTESTPPKSTTAETLNALQRQYGCGPVPLLAAEITARTGKDPGEHHQELAAEFGASCYTRIDAPATSEQKARLQKLSPETVQESKLAGEPITAKLTRAPGNKVSIDGLKVVAPSGWFAARRPAGPSFGHNAVQARSVRGTALRTRAAI